MKRYWQRRDAEGKLQTRGQCFLCEKVRVLKPGWSCGEPTYICSYCGGRNAPRRIERGLDVNGQPVKIA